MNCHGENIACGLAPRSLLKERWKKISASQNSVETVRVTAGGGERRVRRAADVVALEERK